MRNLTCLGRTRTALVSVQTGTEDLPVTAIAPIPSSEDAFFVAHGPICTNHKIEILRVQNGKSTALASFSTTAADNLHDNIIDFRYLNNSASICCILSSGDLVLVRVETEILEDRVEVIGNIEGGILAAEWTLDEEVLAVASGRSKILFMTTGFEVIAEVGLSHTDISKHINQVSVGWGRAETQFRGLRAKNAPRDPTLPEKVEQGILSPCDDGKVRLNWRGDGECLAFSRIESEPDKPPKRVIRVFTRDGQIESFSEPIDGLEGVLSWRPSGNWIATVQRRNDAEAEIVFLERNGLRHGGFPLRRPGNLIRGLSWNSDSNVLAVLLRDRVQFWMMSNYEWHLKQEIVIIGKAEDEAYELTWHPEKPFIVFIRTAYVVERYEYVLDLSKDSSSPPFDYGLVAVVDGETLKLTPLRISNVPPPMSASELSLPSTPIFVSFESIGKSFAILRGRHIDIATWTDFNTIRVANPKIICTISLDKFFASDDFLRQIVLLEQNLVAVLADDIHSGSIIKILRQTEGTDVFEEIHCTQGVGMVIRLFPQLSGVHVFFETEDGTIHDLGDPKSSTPMSASATTRFSTRCAYIGFANVENHDVVFGLTTNGKLYANNRLLSPFVNNRLLTSSCTSFQLTPSQLIFTTQNFLKIVRLRPSIEELDVPTDELDDERTRAVERGSKIVTIMPSTHTVVLQAPRGNLETISPRALVLASVRQSIEKKEFRAAFLTCRTHRIDMNILHSHEPELFMANVPLFIRQLEDVDYIDLFLSSLRAVEPTKVEAMDDKQAIKRTDSETDRVAKVSVICDAILTELLAQYSKTHTQSILTAHLSKIPPDIPSALRVIAQLKDDGSSLIRRATEHICFLADVNHLYDEALGLYRLDVALLIAQRSQKDPREYLPFLRSLNEMETKLCHFTIDDYLKRYNNALINLSQSGPDKTFEDVLAYVTKHNLHQDAMRIYKDQREKYDAILGIYADHLHDKGRHTDAGLAYELVGEKEKAIASYTKAGLWRECLNVAYTIPMSSQDIAQLAIRLADSCVERRQFSEAARLYVDYGKDEAAIKNAVKALAKAYQFTECIRIVNDVCGAEMVPDIVHPAIVSCFSQTTELVSELKAQLNAQIPRLRILREKKAEDPENYFEGITNDIDAPDDISVVATEATTSASLFTRYTAQSAGSRGTRTSSKNRRREERKRARGKKGTIYEEEYLVNSISRLIQRVQDIREDVVRLTVALMVIGKRLEAEETQNSFQRLVEEIRTNISEVFAERMVSSRVSRDETEELPVAREIPVVEVFTVSELLV